jgi:hypothetical protein
MDSRVVTLASLLALVGLAACVDHTPTEADLAAADDVYAPAAVRAATPAALSSANGPALTAPASGHQADGGTSLI